MSDELPVARLQRPLRQTLPRRPVVVTSPTGSGKSSRVPVWTAELFPDGRVLVVQPRRVACRSLARYVARLSGTPLGQGVGYAVRHDDRLSRGTRIAFVTPGVALRMMERLRPEDVVLLDEFHQRGLESDLLLALLLERDHRRLAVLSATLDGERVARHLAGELLSASGRQYPVQVRYYGDEPQPTGRQLAQRVSAAVQRAMSLQAAGDVLVFLPGKGEINDCARALERGGLQVLPLHAELGAREQDRAFEPAPTRRVILSTNVAETSVTLPGVRAVVDSGLVRRTVYRDGRGALTLGPIALDAAEQRAGRAGRLAPGVCLRLWHESGKLEPRTPPEILREDLSQLVLQVAHQAACSGRELRTEQLPWLDPPQPYAVQSATELLRELGLLTDDERLTSVGQQVGRLPLDPALGRLLLAGRDCGALNDVVPLVAALALGRRLFLPGEPRPPDDGQPDPLTDARCDATALILALRQPALARGRVRPEALHEALRIQQQLTRMVGGAAGEGPRPGRSDGPTIERGALERACVEALPLCGFARRPRRKGAWGNGRVELTLGRDSLIEEQVQTILVLDQRTLAEERGRRLRRMATCCMPLPPHRLRQLGAGQVRAVAPRIKDGQLVARLEWMVGTTVLERVEEVPSGAAARRALVQLLLQGHHLAQAVQAARDEVQAAALLAALAGQQAPDFVGWLEQRVEQLGFDSGADLPLLTEADLSPGLLTEEQRGELDRDFPRELTLGGLRLAVSYDLTRREVTLRASTPGRPPPRPDFLPPWPGWSVVYHDGKHAAVLRR